MYEGYFVVQTGKNEGMGSFREGRMLLDLEKLSSLVCI
jgi:hypothetical protein